MSARMERLRRDEHGRLDIKAMDLAGLTSWFDTLGETEGRALAVYKWLWQRGATSFTDMEGVSKALRARLEELAYISFLEPELVLKSKDGTT